MKAETQTAPGETEPGAASMPQDNLSFAGDPIHSEYETYDTGMIRIGVVNIPEVGRYQHRIRATHRGLRKLTVTEQVGKYRRDVAVIKFSDTGLIDAPDGFKPTDVEQAAITAAWSRYTWPTYEPMLFTGRYLPSDLQRFPFQRSPEEGLFEYWDADHSHLLMIEERRDHDDGSKDFYVWTPHSDGVWRIAEPDQLPLYNLDKINGASIIYVHEGAKCARAVQRLIEDDGSLTPDGGKRTGGWRDHPWGKELRGSKPGAVAHIGWTGGAHRSYATDFAPLRRNGARIIFIADNDRAGIDAIREISRSSRLKMEAVIFNDDWPEGFDLANPFPEGRVKSRTRIQDLLTPATWATDAIQTGRRPSYVIRPEAIIEWRWAVSPPLFFHSAYPAKGFSEGEVDAMMRPFSDAEMTARLIRQSLSARADGVDYLPGAKPMVERDGQRLVNQWKPCKLQELPGSAWPLGRLLVRQFPNRSDRKHLVRWGATLSARPEIRMEYAVLLQSEMQGTGKTTLAGIAAELVGQENVSRPNEATLTEGNFNSHLARKRLVIVDEIYSGHSRKTYNKLKSPITDTKVWVNEKYQQPYQINNFAHFVFSSNDLIAMLIDNTDRRFFIPRMSERKLALEFWREFYTWLHAGGFGIIKRCAREFVDQHGPVLPGQAAPMTAAKAAMIENSVSDEMRAAREAARELIERGDSGQRIAVTLEDFQAWHGSLCRERGWRRLTGNRLNEELRRAGLFIRGRDDRLGFDHRVKIGGRKVSVAANFDPGLCPKPAEAIQDAARSMRDLGFGELPF